MTAPRFVRFLCLQVDFARSFNIQPTIMSIFTDCTRCISLLSTVANMTAQQFPPHFRAFRQLNSRKIPPNLLLLADFLLWFHQDIQIQVFPFILPINSAYIIDHFLVCSFFLSSYELQKFFIFLNVHALLSNFPVGVSSSWRCRCCSQLTPCHYKKTLHLTLLFTLISNIWK